LSNNAPDQYPYEPSKVRGRNPVYVIGAAALIVVLVLCVVIIVGVFAAGDLTDSDFVCDDRCLAATEISGTNFAISTQIGVSQTAQSIAQAGTATAEVALQTTATNTPTQVDESADEPSPTTSPTPLPTPSPIPPTEVAAIPVRVVVVGEEIGIGTIRLFAPEAADYPETVRVELDLQLSQQIWTATPESDTSTGTESNDNPAPPPSIPTQAPPATPPPPGTSPPTPNFEESGLAVFQKMGASRFVLESRFTGGGGD
jgi:hypothetical protein